VLIPRELKNQVVNLQNIATGWTLNFFINFFFGGPEGISEYSFGFAALWSALLFLPLAPSELNRRPPCITNEAEEAATEGLPSRYFFKTLETTSS
jgi:hypothetical protein